MSQVFSLWNSRPSPREGRLDGFLKEFRSPEYSNYGDSNTSTSFVLHERALQLCWE